MQEDIKKLIESVPTFNVIMGESHDGFHHEGAYVLTSDFDRIVETLCKENEKLRQQIISKTLCDRMNEPLI